MAYAVHPDHQRKGYATEMSLALIEVLFSHSNAEVILHTSYSSNIGSGKSADICCFKEKGIKHGEVFRILRKSSQLLPSMKNETTDVLTQPNTEGGLRLEKQVFDLIHSENISMNIFNRSDLDNGPSMPYCLGDPLSILPQNIEELRSWCAKGYQFKENESRRTNFLTHPDRQMSTEHYSFRLFCYGIHKGCLPLVQYVLTYHNNIWHRSELRNELSFSESFAFGSKIYTLITYLIVTDQTQIFDYLLTIKEFRDFSFGPGSKNGVGNTPFHTLAKYGSETMIERFLKEKDLVSLCLNPENIKGEGEMNPLQVAKKYERDNRIIGMLEGVVEQRN